MIKSIGPKVRYMKYSFKGTLAGLFYTDDLIIFLNNEYWT